MSPHPNNSTAPTSTTSPASSGPRLNALKHGFYSAAILLPGDDPEAFHRERQANFLLYRPQTIREAILVHAMAEWQWQLDRCTPLQARCDGQALEPAADEAGRVIEPLAHRRLHTTIDMNLHRLRLERAVHRNYRELITVQKQRRLGLLAGAVELPPGCYMERSGEIVSTAIAAVPAPTPAQQAGCQVDLSPAVPAAAAPVSTSPNERNGFREDQQETGAREWRQMPRTIPFFFSRRNPAASVSTPWQPSGSPRSAPLAHPVPSPVLVGHAQVSSC